MPRDPSYLFDVLERSFRLLVRGPQPLALDGRRLGHGLPARALPLDELRSVLLHPSVSLATRDAVLGHLVGLAREHGGKWTVGLAGMLLPGLRHRVARLTRRGPGLAAEVQAAALAGLLEAITDLPPGTEQVGRALLGRAVLAGQRVLDVARVHRRREQGAGVFLEPPRRQPRHPDLALARAVADGVVSAAAAELVGETRIGGVGLRELARELGVPYPALRKRRQRAERVLVAWLTSRLSQTDP